MSRATIDLWVGIFVAFGIAALIFLAVKVSGSSDVSRGSSYSVRAEFVDIGNLRLRAPVKSAGVVVGRVGSIKLINNKAHVRLDINNVFKFPSDTSASILTSGVLGEQYVGLSPGSDEEDLKDGSELKGITQSAIVLENLIGQFIREKPLKPPEPEPALTPTR